MVLSTFLLIRPAPSGGHYCPRPDAHPRRQPVPGWKGAPCSPTSSAASGAGPRRAAGSGAGLPSDDLVDAGAELAQVADLEDLVAAGAVAGHEGIGAVPLLARLR